MTRLAIPNLPWSALDFGDCLVIFDAWDNSIARMDLDGANNSTSQLERDRADAILRAVNSHDELVAALAAIIDCYGVGSTPEQFARHMSDLVDDARAALARAKGDAA